MKIYNYNQTGAFIGASIADKDPENVGQYLIPAMATFIEPPDYAKNQLPFFNPELNKWSIINLPIPRELTEEDKLIEWRKTALLKRAQAKINLASLGLLEKVISEMKTLPVTEPIRILWEDSDTFSRNDFRLVDFCESKLGLSSEQIDRLFMVQ